MRYRTALLASSISHLYVLARIPVTPHVLTLETAHFHTPITPSSNYLTKRFDTTKSEKYIRDISARQDTSWQDDWRIAEIQEPLLTLGGRVYMTNVTLGDQEYTLVIDTGSSDTWVAITSFQCESAITRIPLSQSTCNFGRLYDMKDSTTFEKIPERRFNVSYTDGEFLEGEMGTERFEIGGLVVRQTIGVVERGWWIGDGISSGLMGLAYPILASNNWVMNYTSAVFSLFARGIVPPIFSLALSRPTSTNPRAGGLLAIGGIPYIQHQGEFITVPINPLIANMYAFYSILVDNFAIVPPADSSSANTSELPANLSAGLVPVNMIVDSGSSLMYLPDEIADYLASLFSPRAVYSATSGLYTLSCSALAPKLGVVIGGETFWMDQRDLVTPGNGQCYLSVQRQGGGDPVLGDTFLRNVIAVFDLGSNTMQFAARVPY